MKWQLVVSIDFGEGWRLVLRLVQRSLSELVWAQVMLES